jgi:hypothetical protein
MAVHKANHFAWNVKPTQYLKVASLMNFSAMAAIREEDEGGSDDRRMDQADYHGSFRRQASVVRNLSNRLFTLCCLGLTY